MSSKGVKSFLLVAMDLVFILAVVDIARVVIRFFGTLSSAQVGEKYVELTDYLTIPFGIDAVSTPYGGFFDIDAIVTITIMLAVEVVLGMIRRRA